MFDKFLKEAMSLVVGKPGEEITDLLNSKSYVNEFLIAKKLELTINQTRNLLYKLSDQGLVSSIRKKDKRKGWYTYFWKIEILKTLEFLRDNLSKTIEYLEESIKNRESKRFYVCERCDVEYGEESALLHNFTCEECGNVFVVKDNLKLVKDSKREVEKLIKQRDLIAEEIKKERDKMDKKRQKEMAKEEKKRKARLKSRGRKAKKTREKNKKQKEDKKPTKHKKTKQRKRIHKKSSKKKIKKKRR